MTYIYVDYFFDEFNCSSKKLISIEIQVQELLRLNNCSSSIIFNGMPAEKFKLDSCRMLSIHIPDEPTSISKLNECNVLTIINAHQILGGVLSILKIKNLVSFTGNRTDFPWIEIIQQYDSSTISQA
jgi:hypothetical protein